MLSYGLIIAGIFLGDNYVKNQIEKKEEDYEEEILEGNVTLSKFHNKGAMFSSLEKAPYAVLAGNCTALALTLGLVLETFINQRNKITKLGSAFLLGGALSNVYDRVKKGYVVDYFTVNKGKLKKIVLNISDICIFIGAVFVILGNIFGKSDK